MKLTNKYGLPSGLVNAIVKTMGWNALDSTFDDMGYIVVERKPRVADIHATELIGPPRIKILRERHDHRIYQDVADFIWAFMGTVGHDIAHRASGADDLAEQRLLLPVNGWKIQMRADLLDAENALWDYKFTSVWSYLLNDRRLKDEWNWQLNIYREGFVDAGFHPSRLTCCLVFRDWKVSDAKYKEDYPKTQVLPVNAEAKKKLEVWEYMENRVDLHQSAMIMEDDDLPFCTPEERWERPTTYKVFRGKNKRATKVFDKHSDAMSFAAKQKPSNEYRVEKIAGASIRCEDYCDVAPFCNQFNKGKETASDV